MVPSYQDGDFVVVNKLSYLLSQPKIGHVVIVRTLAHQKLLLKRITKAQKQGGRRLYWVEGDNLKESQDSRVFGWISPDFIVGKAQCILKKPRELSTGTSKLA